LTLTLFDLDGVLRVWDGVAGIEAAHGLPPGALAAIAFEPERLRRAVTGSVRDEEWRTEVARELSDTFRVDGDAVVRAWSEPAGTIDGAVLDLVRAVRVRGSVGLLTNATSRLREDLARLEVLDEFDVVFNSWELGVAKPEPAVFALVCERAGLPPTAMFFIDDAEANVAAARAAGWQAARFEHVEQARRAFAAAGRIYG
jgi:putative hydrolase of the HAD superfamily